MTRVPASAVFCPCTIGGFTAFADVDSVCLAAEITKETWDDIAKLAAVLEPMNDASEVLGSDKATSSLVPVMLLRVLASCETKPADSELLQAVKSVLRASLEQVCRLFKLVFIGVCQGCYCA